MMNRKESAGTMRMWLAMLAWGIESWARRLNLGAMAITVGLPDEAALLGVLRLPNGAAPEQTTHGYPAADGLLVFHAIPSIGNKFSATLRLYGRERDDLLQAAQATIPRGR